MNFCYIICILHLENFVRHLVFFLFEGLLFHRSSNLFLFLLVAQFMVVEGAPQTQGSHVLAPTLKTIVSILTEELGTLGFITMQYHHLILS